MRAPDHTEYFSGVRMVPYDLVRELVLALGVVLLLVVVLAAAFSSPDVEPETIQTWAQNDPVDLVSTAVGELAGTTTSAQYGAPYNGGSNSVQSLGPFSPQAWTGQSLPVDSAQRFVLGPLTSAATSDRALGAAIDTYKGAGDKTRTAWLGDYSKALQKATVADTGEISVADGDYGPLPEMMSAYLTLARAGAVDGYLVNGGHFYQTDYTGPLLFMGDGGYLQGLAQNQHLLGNQWGMMNETGSYPGQTWLWLYTLWYQVPPYNAASNADLLVVLTMTVLSAGLVLVPFIPVVNRIPRWIPLYRLIWRQHYQTRRLRA